MDESFLSAGNQEDQMLVEESDERTAEDRISELPDSLLTHILFNLSTKDAVRTSILSTRWRSLWASVPGLDLGYDDFSNYDAFVSFVNRFLDFHGEICLQRFRVSYNAAEHDASRFELWINTVVKCKIQHINFQNFMKFDGVEIPPSLFMSETLVWLQLYGVVLNIPEAVSLPCVKRMDLEGLMCANDSALDRLVSCCLVLEDFYMIRNPYENVNVLRVCSQTLNSLTILKTDFEYEDGKEYGVVIDAPKLKYLNLTGHQTEYLVIKNVGSSVDVVINVIFDEDDEHELEPNDISKRNFIRTFLTGISFVRHMILSWHTLEAIHDYWKLEPLPKFCNLSHLEATFPEFAWEMLPAFLDSCPNLKSIVLEWDLSSEMEEIRLSFIPQCFLSSLEYVEIKRPITGEATEMELVRYFLENSAILKKLIIRLSHSCRMKEESVILRELLTFPRRSSECQVVVL